MQLVYRGVAYEYTPAEAQSAAQSVKTTAVPSQEIRPAVDLRYRGAAYTVRPFLAKPIRQLICRPIMSLFYRGATYTMSECSDAS